MNKKIIVILASLVIILGVIIGGVSIYRDKTMDSDKLFNDAIENTKNLTGYRFYANSTLMLNNNKTAKTTVTGEVNKSGNLHVWGEIMDTPIEIYQIGTTHYRLDHDNQKWVVVKDTTLPKEALLMMEIDPLSNLNLSDFSNKAYHGKVKNDIGKFYEFGVIPKDGDHIASAYFTDFLYTISIDKTLPAVRRVVINATSKNNPKGKLNMTIDVFDYNEDITIVPPK